MMEAEESCCSGRDKPTLGMTSCVKNSNISTQIGQLFFSESILIEFAFPYKEYMSDLISACKQSRCGRHTCSISLAMGNPGYPK